MSTSLKISGHQRHALRTLADTETGPTLHVLDARTVSSLFRRRLIKHGPHGTRLLTRKGKSFV